VMVGMGLLMLVAAWGSLLILHRRGWTAEALPKPLLRGLALMSFSGWVASLAGWYVTEVGRQPFMVYGQLRTADLVTHTPSPTIATTLVGYAVVYVGLLIAYVATVKHMASKPIDVGPSQDAIPLVPNHAAGLDRTHLAGGAA